MAPVVYFVIPCYCEEAMLPVSAPVFMEKIKLLINTGKADAKSKVLFIDDGSVDNTWLIIKRLSLHNECVAGIRLLKNYGEYNAQRAGLQISRLKAECVVTMDCDLQDDISVVDEMLYKYAFGKNIVFGVRSLRNEDSFLERFSSGCFYFMMRILHTGLKKDYNSFCLFDTEAIDKLLSHKEASFFPALVSSLDMKSETVFYERKARTCGTTKYGFKKKIMLAIDAIFLHSKNLYGSMVVSSVVSLCSMAFFSYCFFGNLLEVATLWLVLFIAFGITGMFSLSFSFAYRRIYSQACTRNSVQFEIAETAF